MNWAGLVLPVFYGGLAAFGGSLALHQQLQPRGSLLLWIQRYLVYLDRECLYVRSQLSSRQLALFSFGCVLVASICIPWLGKEAALISLLAFLPVSQLRQARAKKSRLIDKQVEPWLTALVRALEAAPSLAEAIFSSISATPAPFADELRQLQDEMKMGHALERALADLGRRVESSVLSLALETLRVGQRTGGELPRVLQDAAAALREMERLEGVVRTKTAEGRAQSIVISILPVPLFFAMAWTDPSHFDPLLRTLTGQLLLVLAAVLWLAAIFCAKRILSVRI